MTLPEFRRLLLRHWAKILACTALGLAAALVVFYQRPPPYESEAKLFVRYVLTDDRTPAPPSDDIRPKSPDKGGETIMASEQEIITSFNLARDVASALGPATILGAPGSSQSVDAAAKVIRDGLAVETPARSSVIRVQFRHPRKDLVQPVLRAVIDRYLKMHVEIHRSDGMVGNFLAKEAERLQARLAETEAQLRDAVNKAGVVSPAEFAKANREQILFLERAIYEAQGEYAERAARLEATGADTAEREAKPQVSHAMGTDQISAYENLRARIAMLRSRERELLTYYTENSIRVRELREQLSSAEAMARKIEEQHPVAPYVTSGATPEFAAWEATPRLRTAVVQGLQNKIAVWQAKIEELRAEASRVQAMQGLISQLNIRRELEEANYRYYAASLEQARVNQALGSGKVSNISEVESPTPPTRDWTKTLKLMFGLCAGGVAAGIALAFGIENAGRPAEIKPSPIRRPLTAMIDSPQPKHTHPDQM